jgi:integrase
MGSIRLSDAITEYQAHLKARGLKPNTIKNSAQVLGKALAVWGNIQVSTVSPHHIDRLFTAGGWSPRTANLYLSGVRRFLKWCRSHRYMPLNYDPTESWANVRVPKNQDRDRIPVEMFSELLDAAPHPRDRAIVALGLYTLARGSELSTLKVRDLDLDANTLEFYRHKTQDFDTMPVSAELHTEMVRWLNWYRADQGTLQGDWLLVPAKSPDLWVQDENRRLVRPVGHWSSVKPTVRETKPYRAVQRSLRALGLPAHSEGVHTLRRSSARALADSLRGEGYDGALLRVASLLGHSSTKVTEHYIGWGLERHQRNAMIAGKPMFPVPQGGTVIQFGGSHGHDQAV